MIQWDVNGIKATGMVISSRETGLLFMVFFCISRGSLGMLFGFGGMLVDFVGIYGYLCFFCFRRV